MLPLVTIHDATILSDLVHNDLVSLSFRLNTIFQTTEIVFDELSEHEKYHFKPYIEKGKFQLNSISPEGIDYVFERLTYCPHLCFQDLSVIRLAQESQSLLLTHVRLAQVEANHQGLSAHNIVWLLDELYNAGNISGNYASSCLKKFMNINKRMTDCNCHDRLKTWISS